MLNPAYAPAIRASLAACNFTEAALRAMVGHKDFGGHHDAEVSAWLDFNGDHTPLATLARLLLMGLDVLPSHLQAAAAPATLSDWQKAGLVQETPAGFRATCKLTPFRHLWIASDRSDALQEQARPDWVMGVGKSTMTLANLTLRQPVQSMLDLGCGPGTHAFLAAGHAAAAVASDFNPRAAMFTRFNAALNQLPNVEAVEGDLFQPVANRKFDLIISNPPFVISPRAKFIFRDGGLAGDQFVQRIVREAPQHLAPGGYCQILCNWAHYEGRDWKDDMRAWFAGSKCDAWVLRSETVPAHVYAPTWIRGLEAEAKTNFAGIYREWLQHYADLGIREVSGGAIFLRLSERPFPRVTIADAPESLDGECGGNVRAGFAAQDFLDDHPGPEAFLARRFVVNEQLRLEQEFLPRDAKWQGTTSQLRLQTGFIYAGNADPYISGLLARCDGSRPMRELVSELSGVLNVPEEEFRSGILPILRELVAKQFVAPMPS